MVQPFERIAYPVVFHDSSTFRDVYGGTGEIVLLEAQLLKPPTPSDTVLVFMHPIGGGTYLPLPNALARAGHHVIYCNSRYRGADHALIMEKVVQDLGACLRDARDRLGYRRIVLAGWSGGGSLSLYYQQQARNCTITDTPAGDPFDLTGEDLPVADAMLLLAAHVSRHGTLTEWLDAAVLDERDPTVRDRELDLYDPAAPHQPPYSADFLAAYAQAQIARNRRITAWVKARLEHLRSTGRPYEEFGFVTHGTMAAPCWLDPTVDPSGRRPGHCYMGDPATANNGPVGLARFSTLRSWLSQWSYDDARADGVTCGHDVGVPTLVVGNLADDACTPSHARRLHAAIGHPDRTLVEIEGAEHYYAGPHQAPMLAQATGTVSSWLSERGLV